MQLSPQSIEEGGFITPFRPESYRHQPSGLSGGLSCAGYDVHLGDELLLPMDDDGFPLFDLPVQAEVDGWVIPPRTGVLAVTVEHFALPSHICMHYFNKSTLARRFFNACATLGEPGWHGHLTLELYNQTDRPHRLHKGQPIGQVIFMPLDKPSSQPYAGKYQAQANAPVSAR